MTETVNTTDTRAVVERDVAAGAPGRHGILSVRHGKIHAVREYMDTAYAARKLSGGERAAA